jgi:hypothetical protein
MKLALHQFDTVFAGKRDRGLVSIVKTAAY